MDAKNMTGPVRPVYVVAYPGAEILDITGPMEVFAFSSHKKILLRCMREKGVKLTDTARLALEQLPSLFDEWRPLNPPVWRLWRRN